MPVQIVFKGYHKGKIGFIRGVAEHFGTSGSQSRTTDFGKHTCEPDHKCNACCNGLSYGHICGKQCEACFKGKRRVVEEEAGVFLNGLQVHVELMASNGEVALIDVLSIRPFE